MKHTLVLCGVFLCVSAVAAERAVSWTNPTSYTDGSALAVSAIQRTTIVWGASSNTLTNSKIVTGSVTTTTIDLAPGTWFIAAKTTAGGQDSDLSNIATVTVLPPRPNPPSALTAQERTAFVIKQTRDNLAVVAVGAVPSETQCDSDKGVIVNGSAYYVIPREAVSWGGSVRSEIVVAACS